MAVLFISLRLFEPRGSLGQPTASGAGGGGGTTDTDTPPIVSASDYGTNLYLEFAGISNGTANLLLRN